MEESVRLTSAAVLIRSTSQWPTARRTIRALLETGATVKLFFLGSVPTTADCPTLELPGLECYADTRQPGMGYLPRNTIAAILKRCDLVIPV